jgi:hypothetical protein
MVLAMFGALAPVACIGIQVGEVTGGSSTGGSPTGGVVGAGVPALSPNVGSGYPSLASPCELDLDFGSIPVGEGEESTIMVENQGTGILDLEIGALDPPFSLTLPPSNEVQPGGSVEISVDFQPVNRGSFSSSLVIQTDGVNPSCPAAAGSGSNLTVNLKGTAVQAGILVVNPTTLDFGHTLMNTTQTLPVMLTNTSAAEVDSITCPIGDGENSTGFTVDNCPATLAAGASIQVGISFTPGDGQASSFVKFNGSEGETALLLLQGEPVATAFTFSPEQLDFGYLPPATSVVECLTASNQANAPFAIEQADLDFEDAGGFALSASDNAMPPNPIAYPLTISAGESAKICYSFAPSTAEHQYAGQTMIATNDPNLRFLTIGLFGWGGGPQITCTPTSIDFGPSPINDIQSVPVTCTNTGTAIPGVTLTIGTPTVMSSGAFSASFDPTTNPYPAAGLAPGQKAQIDAIYLPTAVESDTGTLMIPSNGGQGQGVSISLGGEGTN